MGMNAHPLISTDANFRVPDDENPREFRVFLTSSRSQMALSGVEKVPVGS
jgi:hypothetical protein